MSRCNLLIFSAVAILLARNRYVRQTPRPLHPIYGGSPSHLPQEEMASGAHRQELVSFFGVLPVLFPKSLSRKLFPLEINLSKLLQCWPGDSCEFPPLSPNSQESPNAYGRLAASMQFLETITPRSIADVFLIKTSERRFLNIGLADLGIILKLSEVVNKGGDNP
jgi:hypothetical protein